MQRLFTILLFLSFTFNVQLYANPNISIDNSFYCIGHQEGNYQALTASCNCIGSNVTNIEWWDAETGGNLLATGASFNPIQSGNVPDDVEACYTFYVQCVCTDPNCTGTRKKATYEVLNCNINFSDPNNCTYLLVLEDLGGDGWDNASIDVYTSGSGFSGSTTNYYVSNLDCNAALKVIPLQSNNVIQGNTIHQSSFGLTYYNGANELEHSFRLLTPNGEIANDNQGNPVQFSSNPPAFQNIVVSANIANCSSYNCEPNHTFSFQIEMGTSPASQSWSLYETNPDGTLGSLYLSLSGSTYTSLAPGSQVEYQIPLKTCQPFSFVAESNMGTGWDGGSWRMLSDDVHFGTTINDINDVNNGRQLLLEGPVNPSFTNSDEKTFTIPCPNTEANSQILLGDGTCMTNGIVDISEYNSCFPYENHVLPTNCVTESIEIRLNGNVNNTVSISGPFTYTSGIYTVSTSSIDIGQHQLIHSTTYCDGIVTNELIDLEIINDANPIIDCNTSTPVQINLGIPNNGDDDNSTGNYYLDDLGECVQIVPLGLLLNTPIDACEVGEYEIQVFDSNNNPLIVYDINGFALDSVGYSIPSGAIPNPANNLVSYAEFGQTLNYTITHSYSGNNCAGQITVNDNSPPILNPTDYAIACTHPNALDEFYSHTETYTNPNLPFSSSQNTPNLVSSSFLPIDLPCATMGEVIQDVSILLNLSHNDFSDLSVKLHVPAALGINPIDLGLNGAIGSSAIYSLSNAPNLVNLINQSASLTESTTTGTVIQEFSPSQNPVNFGNTWFLEFIDSHDTNANSNQGGLEIITASLSLDLGFPFPYEAIDCTLDAITLVSEQLIDNNCMSSSNFGSSIERIWSATDLSGLTTQSTQIVQLVYPSINDLIIPPDTTLVYTGQMPASLSPAITGFVSYACFDMSTSIQSLCETTITYTDQIILGMGNDFQVIRTWDISNLCAGTNMTIVQNIFVEETCPSNLAVNDNSIPSETYIADNQLSSTGLVPSNNTVTFNAGQTICLNAGFEVLLGAVFEAYIQGCPSNNQNETTTQKQ